MAPGYSVTTHSCMGNGRQSWNRIEIAQNCVRNPRNKVDYGRHTCLMFRFGTRLCFFFVYRHYRTYCPVLCMLCSKAAASAARLLTNPLELRKKPSESIIELLVWLDHTHSLPPNELTSYLFLHLNIYLVPVPFLIYLFNFSLLAYSVSWKFPV